DGSLSRPGASAGSKAGAPLDLAVAQGSGLAGLESDALQRDLDARELGAAGRVELVARPARRRSDEPAAGEDELFGLTMPLAWGGRPEGSITAYYAGRPDDRVAETFSILGAQFSAAAEATSFRTRDLLTLVEVDRSIRAEGNLDRLLQTVLTQMLAFVSAPVGGIFLADDEGMLGLRSNVGLQSGGQPVSWRVGEGFVGEVAEAREPRILAAVSATTVDGMGPLLQGSGSAVAVPLV